MKVSVAIPAYNGEAYISEAIQSVLNQSFRDFELLVVDDCSTDKTLEIAQSFSDPRLRVTRNDERKGLPGNWNRCLALSRGEFICIFHQDDVMAPENLERKVRLLSADSGLGLVHSSAELMTEASAPSAPVDWIEKSYEDFQVEGLQYFFKLLFQGNIICAPTVVARRQLLLDLGGFDEELSFTSDYEMWLKVCVGSRIAFLSQPLVRYRWHAKNASHDFRFEKGAEQSLQAARRALTFYLTQTGRSEEGPILKEALAGIGKVKLWAAGLTRLEDENVNLEERLKAHETHIKEQKAWIDELEKGKTWLAEEIQRWRKTSEEQAIWIDELEKGKTWLAEEMQRWQKTSEEQARSIERKDASLIEKDAWIQEVEKGKDWLENQRASWQKMAEELRSGVEARLLALEKRYKLVLAVTVIAILVFNPLLVLLIAKLFGMLK